MKVNSEAKVWKSSHLQERCNQLPFVSLFINHKYSERKNRVVVYRNHCCRVESRLEGRQGRVHKRLTNKTLLFQALTKLTWICPPMDATRCGESSILSVTVAQNLYTNHTTYIVTE